MLNQTISSVEDSKATVEDSPKNSSKDTHPDCFHCGLVVPIGISFTEEIQGEQRLFCCAGCQAVASLIHQGGLDNFYTFRSSLNRRPEQNKIDFTVYDKLSVQANFVRESHSDTTEKTAYLLLDGITCAACIWLIEKYLLAIDGVIAVKVNALSYQCSIKFDTNTVALSVLMSQLDSIGYTPHPYTQIERQQQQQHQQRELLLRVGLAGFAMMIVGMIAISLYAGAIQGIDSQWVELFRWVSLLIATPVVIYSAQPFWLGAWRNLKRYHLTMDVPVSIAIILAYLASAWATVTQTGEVYFDSISMFTFFLLLGRYFEMRLRYRNQQAAGLTSQLLPMTTTKVLDQNQQRVVALSDISVGDILRVASGETVACDGYILEGRSSVDEALLTGEAEPINKNIGDRVLAGSVNTESTLLIKVTAVGDQTRLSTISHLVEQAEYDKPKLQTIADKVASVFVGLVLIVSAIVYLSWRTIDPDHALWVTLSVLVVTCPCALSLATPTALTASVAMMRKQGLLVLKGHVIETLTHINKVIFDKTGTLTIANPTVKSINILDDSYSDSQIIAIAAALEEGSSHPIALAFINHHLLANAKKIKALDVKITTSAGVSGVINESVYRLGKASFALKKDADALKGTTLKGTTLKANSLRDGLVLSKDNIAIAVIMVSDQLRLSAPVAIDQFKKNNIQTEILSGDNTIAVKGIADELNVDYQSEQTPEKKLHYIQSLQKLKKENSDEHNVIMMVGDGINDVPVLVGADVSVAMDSATDFARTRADSVLLNNNLATLPTIIRLAKKTKAIIKQNILWALAYNLLALPLAAFGFIPPYLAAAGMSASSLIVVMNALRLYK